MWNKMNELTTMPIIKIEVPIQLKCRNGDVLKFESLDFLLRTITKYGADSFVGWRYV